jgi:hypothetical protein
LFAVNGPTSYCRDAIELSTESNDKIVSTLGSIEQEELFNRSFSFFQGIKAGIKIKQFSVEV